LPASRAGERQRHRGLMIGAGEDIVIESQPGGGPDAVRGCTVCGLMIFAGVVAMSGCSTVDMQHMRAAPSEPPPYTGYTSWLAPIRIGNPVRPGGVVRVAGDVEIARKIGGPTE
jgi:hypothetical protein